LSGSRPRFAASLLADAFAGVGASAADAGSERNRKFGEPRLEYPCQLDMKAIEDA